jgi:hypothetical protein
MRMGNRGTCTKEMTPRSCRHLKCKQGMLTVKSRQKRFILTFVERKI